MNGTPHSTGGSERAPEHLGGSHAELATEIAGEVGEMAIAAVPGDASDAVAGARRLQLFHGQGEPLAAHELHRRAAGRLSEDFRQVAHVFKARKRRKKH